MNLSIVDSPDGVTLVGGGPVQARLLGLALRRAPVLVAADGGADRALAAGHVPVAVIGDFDSLSAEARRRIPPDRQHRITEQETTDFDKALRSIAAPFVLALGFAGARIDHSLAVFNTLLRHPGRVCIVLGAEDAVFLCPPDLTLRLPVGDRLSLFPMGAVRGTSDGLRWPIDGIALAPDGLIGTSNAVSAPTVRLQVDAARLLVILPRRRLDAVLDALLPPGSPRGGSE
ncbi:MAG: thiamine diphosphokinase [Rhodobacter sp.]|nr:thiamine diphosphokinase [Rhodobacter sp.]